MLRNEVDKAFKVIKEGGVILYPTDTVWGLGCDATNEQAVARIFEIKGRAAEKSVIILLDEPGRLPSYVSDVPDMAYDLIEFSEKPLTIVFSNAKNMAPGVVADDKTVGIRFPKHDFCQQLISRMRRPLVSTSANISGAPTPKNFSEIAPEIIAGVDYVVDLEQHDTAVKIPSTIMKLEPDGRFSFIRR